MFPNFFSAKLLCTKEASWDSQATQGSQTVVGDDIFAANLGAGIMTEQSEPLI